MAADPARVAARLVAIAPNIAAAADLVFNICTDFRAGRRVEPLDPVSLAADPGIPKARKAELDELNAAIRSEYKRDLHELTEEEAWPLLEALAKALADLARESNASAASDVEQRLEELRQLEPTERDR